MIRLISVKNFRSIQNNVIPIEEITTFVGKNDAGKSNILRCLNLFFNGETDQRTPYEFGADFNINAKVRKQRAKEIVIELGLKLPKSYRRPGHPDTVYWKKVWRESGEHKDAEEIKYCTIKNNLFTKKLELPSRSKIKSLLDNINFIYIPAIKDKNFFIELQGKIYDILAQSVESGLHSSAYGFEMKIQEEFSELIGEIDNTFNNSNSVALPKNLRGIFEALEFNSDKIPLSRRGDGIKIRHIPAILRFIGNKSGNKHKQLITPQIWGFEEPENNVEFFSCFDLNEQFIDAAKHNIQVILTTHSPAIYNIGDAVKDIPNIKVTRFHVSKCDSSGSTELEIIDDYSLHQNIGFIPLIAPIIAETEKKWKLEKENQSASIERLEQELKRNTKHRIFIEGKSDGAIFKKAFETYAPGLMDQIHFELSDNSSANSATDNAKAFHLIHKHNNEDNKLKGVLILDNDSEGIKCKNNFHEFINHTSSNVKTFVLKKPKEIYTLIDDGFKISADLERCLPNEIWQHALTQKWLKKRQANSEKFTENKISEIFDLQENPDDIINRYDEFSQTLINYEFSDKGKEKVSKYISKLSAIEIKRNGILKNFEDITDDIAKHIGYDVLKQ
ncbi:TPA: AAA family ATPase [Serratia marcescens]|nr:AAA family ATPase [Serratia marcescens]